MGVDDDRMSHNGATLLRLDLSEAWGRRWPVISVVSVTGNLDACALVHDCGALPCPWLSRGIDHRSTQISSACNGVPLMDPSSIRNGGQWIWLDIDHHRFPPPSCPERIRPLANSSSAGILAQRSFHMMRVLLRTLTNDTRFVYPC